MGSSRLRHPGLALTLPTSQGVSQWQDLEQGPHPTPAAQADQEEEEEEEEEGWGGAPGGPVATTRSPRCFWDRSQGLGSDHCPITGRPSGPVLSDSHADA